MPNSSDTPNPPNGSEIIIVGDSDKFKDFKEYARSLPEKPFFKTNCKLCGSKFRAEAEEMFARDGNMLKVHRFLHDKGESISHPAVGNHLKNHYKKVNLEEQLREYAEDFSSWSKIQQDKAARAQDHITMLERRLHYIEATTDESDPSSQKRTTESIVKLMDAIHKEEEFLRQLKKEESPVKILLYRFEDIIKVKAEGISSTEAKIILAEVLEEFGRAVEEIEQDG